MTIHTINNNHVIVSTDLFNDGKNEISFFSYDSLVMKIDNDEKIIWLFSAFDYSTTTNKWTNVFLRECFINSTVADIKKAIENKSYKIGDYTINTLFYC